MKIIEQIDCPECSHEIDVALLDNQVDTIGGCVACDHMPSIEDVEDALDIVDYPEDDWRILR